MAREDILVALDALNYTATLAFVANYGLLAIVLGLLFAGLYLSAMRLTAIFWRMNKLNTNIFSNGAAILFCFLQMLLIKAVLGQYEIAIALPFVIANIVASFVTVRLMPALTSGGRTRSERSLLPRDLHPAAADR